MRQELLDKFRSDYYRLGNKHQARIAVNRLMTEYRKTLNTSSKTAIAIDMDYPIELTIQRAESEGHMELGKLLRFANVGRQTNLNQSWDLTRDIFDI